MAGRNPRHNQEDINMKKYIAIIITVIMLMASNLWAAGSCTQTLSDTANPIMKKLTFVCTGDATDGSIPNTDISAANIAALEGFYLYMVSAYPTSGGTAPDAADVTILQGTYDVLGGKGVNLIHASNRQDVYPYSLYMTTWRYWPITTTLTLAVANQATISANYTIELIFVR